MASMEMKIVSDNTEQIKDIAKEAVLRALEAVGLQAEGYAKEIITSKGAIDTGLLRNSITHTVGGQPYSHSYKADRPSKDGKIKTGQASGTLGSENDMTAYIGTNVEYAEYVEYGTSKMSARPFTKPAVQNHMDEYKQIFEYYMSNTDG